LQSGDKKIQDPIVREGEQTSVHFRSDRFYKIDGKFFFSTREGSEIGPYPSKLEAQKGLDRFVQCIESGKDSIYAKRVALSDTWAITNFQ